MSTTGEPLSSVLLELKAELAELDYVIENAESMLVPPSEPTTITMLELRRRKIIQKIESCIAGDLRND